MSDEPTLARPLITWVVRVAIAAALVWAWQVTRGSGPALWWAVAAYAALSLLTGLMLYRARKAQYAKAQARLESIAETQDIPEKDTRP
ncbi:hypothetical protein AAD018_003870 [Aestuariibius insulae]|uniref:hypothetical protein n=1 Tax=Aestuariibius insulae TaxID=2058287 RepID=UPI00345E85E0